MLFRSVHSDQFGAEPAGGAEVNSDGGGLGVLRREDEGLVAWDERVSCTGGCGELQIGQLDLITANGDIQRGLGRLAVSTVDRDGQRARWFDSSADERDQGCAEIKIEGDCEGVEILVVACDIAEKCVKTVSHKE